MPESGISMGLSIFYILAKLFNSGDKPPCRQKIFWFITAARGKQLKHF